MFQKYFLTIFFCCTASAAPWFVSFPSDINWSVKESAHFSVLYKNPPENSQSDLANRILDAAERAHTLLDPIFPPGPSRTWIIAADFSDSLNGYGMPYPYAHFVLFLASPGPGSELSSYQSILDSLVLHEYTHVRHLYPAAGVYPWIRRVFGSWVSPNSLMPIHFHEGLATFMETKFLSGGRGQGILFPMYRRMAVEAGKWNLEARPLDRMDGSFGLWPYGTTPYFLGYEFYSALWKLKGEAGIHQFVEQTSKVLPYLFPLAVSDVFGSRIEDIWEKHFEESEKETRKEITAIKNGGLSPLNTLTETGHHKSAILLSPDSKSILFRASSPSISPGWYELTLGEKASKKWPIPESPIESACWGARDGNEFFLSVKTETKNFYELNTLVAFDRTRHKIWTPRLKEQAQALNHVHELGCSRDFKHVVVSQGEALENSLIALKWEGDELSETQRWKAPSGTWVSAIGVREDIWFLLRAGDKTKMYRWPLGSAPLAMAELPGRAYALHPARAPGKWNVVADSDGRNEIWEIDVSGRRMTKVVSLLGGANSFAETSDGFFVSRYEDGGYDIAQAVRKPGGKTVSLASASPEPAPKDPTDYPSKGYSPLGSLVPPWWFLSTYLVPNGIQVLGWIPAFDLSQKHIYDLTFGYDSRGFGLGDLIYTYRFGGSFELGIEGYYLPTYLISQSVLQPFWGGNVKLSSPIAGGPFSLTGSVGYRRTETSPIQAQAQDVSVSVGASFSEFFEQRPQDVSPTLGTRLSIDYSQTLSALGSTYDSYRATASLDQYLWRFYFGARTGYTEGAPLFQSYQLWGGELPLSLGRGFFCNRGFPAEIFIDRRVTTFTVEYRFPIVRIDHGYRLLPIFLENVSGAFVADVTTGDNGKRHAEDTYKETPLIYLSEYFPSVGVELKSSWKIGFWGRGNARLGLYHAFSGPNGYIPDPVYASLGLSAGF